MAINLLFDYKTDFDLLRMEYGRNTDKIIIYNIIYCILLVIKPLFLSSVPTLLLIKHQVKIAM